MKKWNGRQIDKETNKSWTKEIANKLVTDITILYGLAMYMFDEGKKTGFFL